VRIDVGPTSHRPMAWQKRRRFDASIPMWSSSRHRSASPVDKAA